MTERSFETLLYAVEDGVATITLNRPEKMSTTRSAATRRARRSGSATSTATAAAW